MSALQKRFLIMPLKNEEVLYNDLGSVHTVSIDTSRWKKETAAEDASVGLF